MHFSKCIHMNRIRFRKWVQGPRSSNRNRWKGYVFEIRNQFDWILNLSQVSRIIFQWQPSNRYNSLHELKFNGHFWNARWYVEGTCACDAIDNIAKYTRTHFADTKIDKYWTAHCPLPHKTVWTIYGTRKWWYHCSRSVPQSIRLCNWNVRSYIWVRSRVSQPFIATHSRCAVGHNA